MLGEFFDRVTQRQKELTVYSPATAPDLVDRLATRNVAIDRQPLPADGPDPFVAIRDDEDVDSIVQLDDLQTLLTPPVVEPGAQSDHSQGHRLLLKLLEDTLFASLSVRQLLATTREIEDRAYRVGQGTLRVGFESLAAFEAQTSLYRELCEQTELDVHVYGRPDWEFPPIDGLACHVQPLAEDPFWFLAFDGGPQTEQACALVARRHNGGYDGFWTYDLELVGEILQTIRSMDDAS